MINKIHSKFDRGQVGIGTLIVFIAMVLVAAIAAGVLINTAGFLQSQAEATGQDSTSEVSDRLNIISKAGIVAGIDSDTDGTDDTWEIDTLELNVRKSAGSGPVDLSEVTIQLIGPNGETTVTHISDDGTTDTQGNTEASPGSFDVSNIIPDTNTDDPVETTLKKQEHRSKFLIPLEPDGSSADAALAEDEDLTLVITTSTGASTRITFQVPSLPEEDGAEIEL